MKGTIMFIINFVIANIELIAIAFVIVLSVVLIARGQEMIEALAKKSPAVDRYLNDNM